LHALQPSRSTSQALPFHTRTPGRLLLASLALKSLHHLLPSAVLGPAPPWTLVCLWAGTACEVALLWARTVLWWARSACVVLFMSSHRPRCAVHELAPPARSHCVMQGMISVPMLCVGQYCCLVGSCPHHMDHVHPFHHLVHWVHLEYLPGCPWARLAPSTCTVLRVARTARKHALPLALALYFLRHALLASTPYPSACAICEFASPSSSHRPAAAAEACFAAFMAAAKAFSAGLSWVEQAQHTWHTQHKRLLPSMNLPLGSTTAPSTWPWNAPHASVRWAQALDLNCLCPSPCAGECRCLGPAKEMNRVPVGPRQRLPSAIPKKALHPAQEMQHTSAWQVPGARHAAHGRTHRHGCAHPPPNLMRSPAEAAPLTRCPATFVSAPPTRSHTLTCTSCASMGAASHLAHFAGAGWARGSAVWPYRADPPAAPAHEGGPGQPGTDDRWVPKCQLTKVWRSVRRASAPGHKAGSRQPGTGDRRVGA